MVCGQMSKIEAVDMLTTLRRCVVKATCLTWDVASDYFDPLTQAVRESDWWRVRTMAGVDAADAATKTEIIADQLLDMADRIDKYLQYLQEGENHDTNTIHGDDGERGGSGGSV